MKGKTSITLSKDVIKEIDRIAGSRESRSSFIERVVRRYLRDRKRAAIHARDLRRINANVQQLNAEAEDVLEYQSSGQ